MEPIDLTMNDPSLGPGPARAPAPRRVEVVAGVDATEVATTRALAGLPGEVAWLRTVGDRGPPSGLRGHFAGGLILGCPGRGQDGSARRGRLFRWGGGDGPGRLGAGRGPSPDRPPAR